MNTTSCSAMAAATVVLSAWCSGATANEVREHDAHEHGHGVLNVAVDGQELALELHVPAVNVVGFEHKPGNEAQANAVRTAIETFKDPEALFALNPAAGCRTEAVHVELAGMTHVATGGRENEHEDKEAHATDDHTDETHSELDAEYHFRCDNPQALESLQLKLFEHLQDAEEIEAHVVTETLQTSVELNADSVVLPLRQ